VILRRPSTAAVVAVAAIAVPLQLHVALAQSRHVTPTRQSQSGSLSLHVTSPPTATTPRLQAQTVQPASVQPAGGLGRNLRRWIVGGWHAKDPRAGPGDARRRARLARARRARIHHRRGHLSPAHPRAHAAGDPNETISDFQFAPASVTIHVGDTITWTNNGPSSHTATASNGSFNTGVLKKGASASRTFTQAGTFAYICQIHPFMHGTVIVLANATITTPAKTPPPSPTTPSTLSPPPTQSPTTTTAPTATSPTTATTAAGQTLPSTGFALSGSLVCGIGLVGLGMALRRRSAAGDVPPAER
jgi:plastocyanin